MIRYVPADVRDEATNLGAVSNPARGGGCVSRAVGHDTIRRHYIDGDAEARLLEILTGLGAFGVSKRWLLWCNVGLKYLYLLKF